MKEQEVLAIIHANDKEKLELAKKRLLESYVISNEPVEKQPVIKNVIQEL